MCFNLSLRNVCKSFKNYTLYFLTLAFGVCVFYVFNSIEAQQVMMEISSSTAEMMKTLTKMTGIVSVFVSIVLGFLIVYANNFLIRRRKKEFGIYLTLGMDRSKVSRMLVTETLIIGILSLVVGLAVGVFLSQWLSVLTARLFEVDMTGYRFVFSSEAFMKTIVYFGLIFVIVMVISAIAISKFKLIDLINAARQNEEPKLKNPVLSVVLFIISIICLGTAYALVLKNGIAYFDRKLLFEVSIGAIGTFLFFASLSGFFLRLIQSNKKLYLKELNMFILRQINSRINTAHTSISLICLMLFCTIGILSTGMGINKGIEENYRKSTMPFDVSFISQSSTSIAGQFAKDGFDLGQYTDKYVEFSNYLKENLRNEVVLERVREDLPENIKSFYMDYQLLLVRVSDYNENMRLQGKPAIELGAGQVALYSTDAMNSEGLRAALERFIAGKFTVSISDHEYPVYSQLLTDSLETNSGATSGGITLALIVPDQMIEDLGCKVFRTLLCFNCKNDSSAMQSKLVDDLYTFYEGREDELQVFVFTKQIVKDIAAGMKAVISFLGIYIGIVFLITSAAVLALQQLSEAADNRQRYAVLKKIGADDQLINRALFKQIAIYFTLPLALACVHSVVGIKVVNDVLCEFGSYNVTTNIIVTALLILLVYSAYFLATYLESKNIILKSER
jgi:putative ABC transport system permease protein